MQQYTVKNQAYLLTQNPTVTDVRSFTEWKAAGRSVKKGEKALRVWVPKVREDPETGKVAERFILGPVFDISQTEPESEREARIAAKRDTRAARRAGHAERRAA